MNVYHIKDTSYIWEGCMAGCRKGGTNVEIWEVKNAKKKRKKKENLGF